MENQESKSKIKKKKHRFLKLMLLIVIVCAVKILANKCAEREMNKVIEQYPFQFSNADTLYYITDNFTVPTYYEYNGKAYTVKWKSSSDALQINDNGEIVVNRPKNSSKTVILTEIYKKFLIGKATKTYELTIIPTEALNPDDINVITREDLENKTYNKEMTAYLDNNGNITSMYGNFGKTEIQSAEDAKAVVIAYAKEFGNVIKLLGVAHNTEDGIEVGVYPMMISQNHPLASVRDSFNAVFVHGDAVGDVMFYGRGAGEFPTASAVVGDVIDVVRDTQYHCTGRISCTCYRTTPVKNFKNVKNKFFLRMQVENKPGVLASIAMVFGVHKVSITKVMQKEQCENADVAELVIVTEAVKESQMLDSLEHLKDMETIREVSSVIREY